MREAFALLYSKIVLETLVILGVVALVVGRIRRRLRILPDQPNRAPLRWLVALNKDARLHRRLARLAARARSCAIGGRRHRHRTMRSPSQRFALDVESVLIDLDEQLIASTNADFDEARRIVKQVRKDAERVDQLLIRLERIIARESEDPTATLSRDPINELSVRLERLEELTGESQSRVIESTGTDQPQHVLEATADVLESSS